MITATELRHLVARLCEAGFEDDINWQENASNPEDCDEFAREAIFVICNSGMHHRVAQGIYERVMAKLDADRPVDKAFGHKGKVAAIEHIWKHRGTLYDRWMIEPATLTDQLEFLVSLPWIGNVTKYHLAKNFGVQVAKPDVHLKRLADREGVTAQQLCERLAAETGYKVATVDVILWRACAIGLINSRQALAA